MSVDKEDPKKAKETPDDPFIWLEAVEGEEALAWVNQQNADTLSVLEKDPLYAPFYDASYEIISATDRIPYGPIRNGMVYNFWQDGTHVRGILRRTSLSSYESATPEWETVLDIDALAGEEQENWVYKGSTCLAPEYRRCMVTLSRGGKDASVYREYDLETKTFVDDGFVVPEAKTGLTWLDHDTLLIGSDFGPGSLTKSGYPRIVKRWKRGTALVDAETLFEGKETDMGCWPSVSHRPEGTVALISRYLSFFESEVFVIRPDERLIRVPLQRSADVNAVFADHIVFMLRQPWVVGDQTYAQGTVMALSLARLSKTLNPAALTTLYTPDEKTGGVRLSASKEALYFSVLEDVKGRVFSMTFDGASKTWKKRDVPMPPLGAVDVVSANDYESRIFLNYEGFLTPDQLFLFEGGEGPPRPVKSTPERFDAEGLKVEQLRAKSADGTEIPFFLVRRADQDGPVPTLLYGYGGFEVSLTPRYIASFGRLWLERGGAFAMANIRGGGEYGPRWHTAALKENRQRAFDDFIAVAEHLVDAKTTVPEKLGIMGGSNGGLLVGTALTQRPGLFGAVVCQVPLLDMIRYTQLLAGASWAAEYGDPSDPDMREVIMKYSPYHNLHRETDYPKAFFLTSTKDDRVHPGHARKMVARMKAYGKPVFYYENTEGGHSASANQKQTARRTALEFVYLSRQLGLAELPVTSEAKNAE